MEGAPRIEIFRPGGPLRVPQKFLLAGPNANWGCTEECGPSVDKYGREDQDWLRSMAPDAAWRLEPFSGHRLLWSGQEQASSPPAGRALEEFIQLHDATPEEILQFARMWGPLHTCSCHGAPFTEHFPLGFFCGFSVDAHGDEAVSVTCRRPQFEHWIKEKTRKNPRGQDTMRMNHGASGAGSRSSYILTMQFSFT